MLFICVLFIGLGLPHDYVRAYMWYSLSAGFNADVVALTLSMTDAQIAEAKRLAREWKPRSPQIVRSEDTAPTTAPKQNRAEVPLKKEGGTFVVPVQINGAITLDFTVDSGAADVSVPLDVFSTLTRTGTIKDTDIIGENT